MKKKTNLGDSPKNFFTLAADLGAGVSIPYPEIKYFTMKGKK